MRKVTGDQLGSSRERRADALVQHRQRPPRRRGLERVDDNAPTQTRVGPMIPSYRSTASFRRAHQCSPSDASSIGAPSGPPSRSAKPTSSTQPSTTEVIAASPGLSPALTRRHLAHERDHGRQSSRARRLPLPCARSRRTREHGFGHDPERPFGADEEPAQVRACVGARNRSQLHERAVGEHGPSGPAPDVRSRRSRRTLARPSRSRSTRRPRRSRATAGSWPVVRPCCSSSRSRWEPRTPASTVTVPATPRRSR